MSNYASEAHPGSRLLLVLSLMGLAALLFYLLQNSGRIQGGDIALPKLLWLAYAILFWFCLPLLIVLDQRTTIIWRRIYAIFLTNMLLRAVLELFMMYVTVSWSPYYGLGHDLFTVVLLLALVGACKKHLQKGLLLSNLYIIIAMFAIEIGFVLYMLLRVSDGEQAIYFVPGDPQHAAVLQVTWVVNLMLTGYLFVFSRRWTRGELVFPGD